jgi:hypothetical protein
MRRGRILTNLLRRCFRRNRILEALTFPCAHRFRVHLVFGSRRSIRCLWRTWCPRCAFETLNQGGWLVTSAHSLGNFRLKLPTLARFNSLLESIITFYSSTNYRRLCRWCVYWALLQVRFSLPEIPWQQRQYTQQIRT